MLDQLITQFMSSGAANEVVADVTRETDLDEGQARQAVEATAAGAADAANSQGGLAAMAGSLLGGGGLAGMAGSLFGGASANDSGGISPQLVQTIATQVAERTGLSPAIATTVVQMALPKILELFQGGDDD